MTVKIVTDSTCDLSPEIIRELDITIVPVYIQFGNQSYRDGIDISREEFYRRLAVQNPLPTTSVPGVGLFKQIYQSLADSGTTEILSIHISQVFSSIFQVAHASAQEIKNASVTVFDSRQLSLGMGFLTETAARAAREGKKMAEIVSLLEDQIRRTIVIACLDSLDFLRRSGRMNGALTRLGDLLQIKLLLKMYDGKPITVKAHTIHRATEWMAEQIRRMGKLERFALVHTDAYKMAAHLYEQVRQKVEIADNPFSTRITPAFGVHLGPGAAGFVCVSARDQ